MRKTLLFAISIMLLASCSLSKKAANTGQGRGTEATAIKQHEAMAPAARPDSFATANSLINQALEAQPTFTTMNMSKFDASIQIGSIHYTMRGSMRINKDSLISISLQPMLGIEVIRIEFRNEYFTVYDKMNHRYCETPYDAIHIATGIPVDFRIIQSIVSANFFSIPHRDEKSFCQAESTDSTYTIVGRDELNRMYQYFEIYQKYPLLAHAGMKQGSDKSTPTSLAVTSNAPFMVSYANYSTIIKRNKNLLFPYLINIDIDHRLFHFTVTVNAEKITVNEPITTTAVNTEKYTRVPFNQIISLGQ